MQSCVEPSRDPIKESFVQPLVGSLVSVDRFPLDLSPAVGFQKEPKASDLLRDERDTFFTDQYPRSASASREFFTALQCSASPLSFAFADTSTILPRPAHICKAKHARQTTCRPNDA